MQIVTLLLPVLVFQTGGKLQIKDAKVGQGMPAKVGDYITVDYTGKLTNGTTFDTSKGAGREPFKFILGAGMVIKGWDQGVQGMKVGGKRLLTIPSSLAYGERGAGADIPPNATLKFEVELRKIERVKTVTLRPGKGAGATAGSTISLHYKGTLANGKEFDNSYKRQQPFPVTLGQSQVIPGFTMGLLGIKKGEKRKITIPPSLGYGAQSPDPIPANSTLIFEIEALDVTK
jgi:FKBP-type peptidyl-prolyl cis-trans isomerase